MRTPNYHQARKQKEQSRKLRQNEKQQRRAAARTGAGDPQSGEAGADSPVPATPSATDGTA
jgi:hypothetical protein